MSIQQRHPVNDCYDTSRKYKFGQLGIALRGSVFDWRKSPGSNLYSGGSIVTTTNE